MPQQDMVVYRSDRSVVYCGDSSEVVSYLPRDFVDLIVTDPPYGVGYQSNTRREKFDKIVGDDDNAFVAGILRSCQRALKENRHMYVFGPCQIDGLQIGATAELIWSKVSRGMGDLSLPWSTNHEKITFAVSRPTDRRVGGRLTAKLRQGSVISVNRITGTAVNRHPTEKPVPLMRILIEASSLVDEMVLDPFAGSGSTGVAAVLAGRRTILIEKDPGYAEIAVQRVRAAESLAEQMSAI